jgi:hypothetical protein
MTSETSVTSMTSTLHPAADEPPPAVQQQHQHMNSPRPPAPSLLLHQHSGIGP